MVPASYLDTIKLNHLFHLKNDKIKKIIKVQNKWFESFEFNRAVIWKIFPKLKYKPAIIFFTWKMLHNALPTLGNLHIKNVMKLS